MEYTIPDGKLSLKDFMLKEGIKDDTLDYINDIISVNKYCAYVDEYDDDSGEIMLVVIGDNYHNNIIPLMLSYIWIDTLPGVEAIALITTQDDYVTMTFSISL